MKVTGFSRPKRRHCQFVGIANPSRFASFIYLAFPVCHILQREQDRLKRSNDSKHKQFAVDPSGLALFLLPTVFCTRLTIEYIKIYCTWRRTTEPSSRLQTEGAKGTELGTRRQNLHAPSFTFPCGFKTSTLLFGININTSKLQARSFIELFTRHHIIAQLQTKEQWNNVYTLKQ